MSGSIKTLKGVSMNSRSPDAAGRPRLLVVNRVGVIDRREDAPIRSNEAHLEVLVVLASNAVMLPSGYPDHWEASLKHTVSE